MDTAQTPTAVSIPILVGVTGKRKSRLDRLGVSEDLVHRKLRNAFQLLQELTPNSPKLLLCGMADGVDEIAARLVIEAVDQHDPTRREFHDWSIVGLSPMPEEAFVDDFGSGGWWYHALEDEQRKLIRLMPLKTLAKPAPPDAASSAPPFYTAEDLRRPPGGSNPARTEHYEQLGMVLAERSTVMIAVMPKDEMPDRPGGTAQVVAHRLNGWRPGWPSGPSRDIAARNSEIVAPAPLATPVANDVWLIPIGGPSGETNPVDVRILRQRSESQPVWPTAISSPEPAGCLAKFLSFWRRLAAALLTLLRWRTDPDALIGYGRRYPNRAQLSCPLLRPLNAFNRRAADVAPRPSPKWDDTIDAHPGEPEQWSPLAETERLRGTFSDIQRDRKRRVVDTATWLAGIAIVSIALLEFYAELFERPWWKWLQPVPLVYVVLIVAAVLLYRRAVRRSWPAVAEDYRLVAEALRVQIVWWRIGLTMRHDRVDNVILRYDTGGFQLLRQALATLLDAVWFSHAEMPPAAADRLPDPVFEWIDSEDRRNRGQIQYHEQTVVDRKRRYGRDEFIAWSLFGVSLGSAVWLAAYTGVEMLDYRDEAMNWIADISPAWPIPLLGFLAAAMLLWVLGTEDIRSPELAFKAPHIIGSWIAGILLGAAIVALWAIFDLDHHGLRKLLFLGSVILLAWGGIIRYGTEKIAIEAEAQGSETALPIYRRAKAALEEVERHAADPETARRRERIIRDLGEFALAETEVWLRSHRERPLHPALG